MAEPRFSDAYHLDPAAADTIVGLVAELRDRIRALEAERDRALADAEASARVMRELQPALEKLQQALKMCGEAVRLALQTHDIYALAPEEPPA